MNKRLESIEELVAFSVGVSADSRFILRVPTYNLEQDDYYLRYSKYGERIQLGVELGKKLFEIWAKKPVYQGAKTLEPRGVMSMAGILKRLGETGAADQISSAAKRAKELSAARSRNYYRKIIREKLDDLEKYVNSHGEAIGVTASMFQLPIELANALEDEETQK